MASTIQRQERPPELASATRFLPTMECSGKADEIVVAIASSASLSAAFTISRCPPEDAGRRFRSCAASAMTAAALRAARTATASDGSFISDVPRAAWRLAHLHPEHHAAVLVLEVVAVEHIGLVPRERAGEVDCHPHALARPHQHRVLAAVVGGKAS